jgi:hypothetical protein
MAPPRFILTETFKHHRPEYVRAIAQRHGFVPQTQAGTAKSEIWSKPDGNGGHWIIRMDAMGHDTKFHFGGRPHYHKNWVASDAILAKYLTKYAPEAWVYNDAGAVMGQAGQLTGKGGKSDRHAKDQHIPR